MSGQPTPAKVNLAAEFAQSGVGPVLKQLDDGSFSPGAVAGPPSPE